MAEFYLHISSRVSLRTPEQKSCFGKNRTHDFRTTSRCVRLPTRPLAEKHITPRLSIGIVVVVAAVVVVVVVVSHIQRIGCQPEKTTLHGGQSRSWSVEQGKRQGNEIRKRSCNKGTRCTAATSAVVKGGRKVRIELLWPRGKRSPASPRTYRSPSMTVCSFCLPVRSPQQLRYVRYEACTD